MKKSCFTGTGFQLQSCTGDTAWLGFHKIRAGYSGHGCFHDDPHDGAGNGEPVSGGKRYAASRMDAEILR
jgi:hypothetical protein